MKTIYLFILLILFSSFVFAQDSNIYDFVNNVKSDSSSFTIVLGKQMDNNEIKSASELASFLGITKSRFDDEISVKENLIIIGNPSTNKITYDLLGEWTYGKNKGLVKVIGSNLIIAGSSTEDTQIGIDVVKNYEANKDKLLNEEYVASELFSPSNSMLMIVIGIVVVVIIGLAILLLKKKKKPNQIMQKPIEQRLQQPFEQKQPLMQQTPEEKQIFAYVQRNLVRGYQKEDLKKALLNQGWDVSLVEKVFMKF